MNFSLGYLLPLECGTTKTLEEQFKMQTKHFERFERRKLTKSELAELWQKIKADEAMREAEFKRVAIKFISCLLVVFIGLSCLLIYLVCSGAFN